MANKVAITKVKLSDKNVTTGTKITVQIYAYSITQEPTNERLAFTLGGNNKIKT